MSIRKSIYLVMASLVMSVTFAAAADAATPRNRAGQTAARSQPAARQAPVARRQAAMRQNRAVRPARAMRPGRATAARGGADRESGQVDALNQQSLQAARGTAQ